MTNNQYEKESVERGLKRHDQIIGSLEDALRIAQESRREYVNRHNLNKHEHKWLDITCLGYKTSEQICEGCGVRRKKDDDAHSHMVD